MATLLNERASICSLFMCGIVLCFNDIRRNCRLIRFTSDFFTYPVEFVSKLAEMVGGAVKPILPPFYAKYGDVCGCG